MKGWLVLTTVIYVTTLTSGCASTQTGVPPQGNQRGEPGECRIVLNGYSEAQLSNVTADTVSIQLSDHSSMRINELTSISIDTETNDYSRLDVGKNNQGGGEDSE